MILTSFDVLICHLNIIFSEMSVYVFCPFCNWTVFLLLIFESSLYSLGHSPLSATWLANIFSQFIACLFIFLSNFYAKPVTPVAFIGYDANLIIYLLSFYILEFISSLCIPLIYISLCLFQLPKLCK